MLTFVGTSVVGGAILEESYLNQGGVGVTGGLVEGILSQKHQPRACSFKCICQADFFMKREKNY